MYGDLEGPVTKLKKGRLSVSVENNKCIAWAVGAEDIELSKNNVAKVELVSQNVMVGDLESGGGKSKFVNIYRLKMSDGTTTQLRLIAGGAAKVLTLIK